ncbi:hypothetical protein CHX27_04720 [Flavobacterium aurantiibacter]|uniref:Uncharacterized protein n=1 Tax=Flavobacterium aurantiibacter TaxID=2023067 RepID=A0A255ZZP2_9FLAO|nr:hypothetical protein CHX27_04720 [Flavobacterium aurantiibacter]
MAAKVREWPGFCRNAQKKSKKHLLFKFGFQDISKNLKILRKLPLKSAVFQFFFLLNLSKRKWHDCG